MAKNNNLTDFLTGVADAIRRKRGTTGKINPQNFEEEISGIPTRKPEQEKAVTITENGTTIVLPDTGKTISKITITVNVSGCGGGGYTVYFRDGIWIADTVTISVEYADGSTETLTSQNDMGGKSRSNVVKMTFTDTNSDRYVRYKMPANGGSEETLYLWPTATLVLTADAEIEEIGK